MFDSLSERIDSALKHLRGSGRLTELNVATTVKEVRQALVQADVQYKVAKEVTSRIRDKALGKEILLSVSPGELFVKIVAEELTTLMGQQEPSPQSFGSAQRNSRRRPSRSRQDDFLWKIGSLGEEAWHRLSAGGMRCA